MGWARGVNMYGRDIGYAVEATCDEPGCEACIDRGLGYCCGDLARVYGDDVPGCGRYFCGDHLYYGRPPLCGACMDEYAEEA